MAQLLLALPIHKVAVCVASHAVCSFRTKRSPSIRGDEREFVIKYEGSEQLRPVIDS